MGFITMPLIKSFLYSWIIERAIDEVKIYR